MRKLITFLFLFIYMLGLVSCKEKKTKQPEYNKQEEKTIPKNSLNFIKNCFIL